MENFWSSLGDFFINTIGPFLLDLLINIFSIVPQLIYFLCSCCFTIMDVVQLLFRKLVGLDTYFIAGGKGEQTGDFLLQILQKTFMGSEEYSIVSTVFLSMIIIGAILLVVTTIAAILRNEYTPDKEKKNSKAGIVKNFFKAIASFAIIPITCYFGMYLGNEILIAIDKATSPETMVTVETNVDLQQYIEYDPTTHSAVRITFSDYSTPTKYTPMSAIANRICLYHANRIRTDEAFYSNVIKSSDSPTGETSNFNIFNQATTKDEAANLVDGVFLMNAKLIKPQTIKTEDLDFNLGATSIWRPGGEVDDFDRYDVGLVSYYYNLWYYNFPVAIVFIIIVGKLMFSLVMGLMSRMFSLLALLFVSPIIIAFMPVDNGTSFGEWRAHFITKLLSAYVTIFVLNIFYIVLPIVNTLNFFGGATGFAWADFVVQGLFTIAGMLAITEIDKMFATMLKIGKVSSSLASEGKSSTEGVLSAVRTVGNITRTGVGVAVGGATLAAGAVGAVGGGTMALGERFYHGSRERSNSNAMRTLSTDARRTDTSIRRNAINAQSAQIHTTAQTEINNDINRRFASYQASGGTMNLNEWENARNDASAMSAMNRWNSMTPAQQSATGFTNIDDYLNNEYAHNNNGFANYADWYNNGVTASADEAAGRGLLDENYRNNQIAQREIDLRNEVDNAITTGIYTNNIQRDAINNYNTEIARRNTARTNYNARQQDRDYHHDRRTNNAGYRMYRSGRERMDRGLDRIYRSTQRHRH